eukprot:scaffold9523_cov103-Cylindrotheca_fusiformis.AAC.2
MQWPRMVDAVNSADEDVANLLVPVLFHQPEVSGSGMKYFQMPKKQNELRRIKLSFELATST